MKRNNVGEQALVAAAAAQELEEPEITEGEIVATKGISKEKTLEIAKKLKMRRQQTCHFGCAQ